MNNQQKTPSEDKFNTKIDVSGSTGNITVIGRMKQLSIPILISLSILLIAAVNLSGFDMKPIIEKALATPTLRPTIDIVEDILVFEENSMGVSESVAKTTEMQEFNLIIESIENNCREAIYNTDCWLILGYITPSHRKSIYAFTRAYEINTKVADPHYSLGNMYYELAIIDLIRKGQFTVDGNKLLIKLEPDEESKLIFQKILHEYEQAKELPLLKDIDPSSQFTISMFNVIGHTENQIADFLSGSGSFVLHRTDNIKASSWISDIYPSRDEEMAVFFLDNIDYMKKHPEEYPNLPELIGALQGLD